MEDKLLKKPLTGSMRPDGEALSLKEYENRGGYQALRKALQRDPKEIVEQVKQSNLRGRGGAGFPTGIKWSFMPEGAPHPRYLIANADEMEPGTFKDRMLMEGNPHQLIEGIAVSAYALQVDIAYIFLRWECNVPHIVKNGAEWYKGLSHTDEGGTKIYGVSGRVKKTGAGELPMGTTVREILKEHAGGMREGFKFRALIPGGASTDFLLEEHLDVRMDFDSMPKVGSRLGTGTMIVLDDKTCPVGMVHNLEQFFARESCGWCTPCRDGLPWIAEILKAIEEGRGQLGDIDILESHTRLLRLGHTFCALAPGAMEPLQSALKYFREDFERHIKEKRCPWKYTHP